MSRACTRSFNSSSEGARSAPGAPPPAAIDPLATVPHCEPASEASRGENLRHARAVWLRYGTPQKSSPLLWVWVAHRKKSVFNKGGSQTPCARAARPCSIRSFPAAL
eukprot:4514809-Prymnesium_polylepis.1